jgi:hypothetical protein
MPTASQERMTALMFKESKIFSSTTVKSGWVFLAARRIFCSRVGVKGS